MPSELDARMGKRIHRLSRGSDPECAFPYELLPGLSRREFLRAIGAWIVVPVPQSRDELPGSTEAEDRDSGGREERTNPPEPLFLTFDDGPMDSTRGILDCLEAREQKATFFFLGRNLANPRYRDAAVRALLEGHDIGNHSYSHPSFSQIGPGHVESEIRRTYELIEEVVLAAGVDATRQNLFFRFPYGDEGYGSSYRAARNVLSRLGYRIASWTRDTHDWQMDLGGWWRQSWRVLSILRHAHAGDVVLMHDRNRTARLLPSAIEVLARRSLVSLQLSKFDELLAEASQESISAEESDARGWSDYLGIRSLLEQLLPGN
ncbi:MAG: polysaccharide deacetylase family protein [Thermodesulfobacteriota bacterium]